MIIIDSSEDKSTSTMPHLDDATYSPDLESLCGADVCISTLGAPCHSEALLRVHLKSRCVLVQVKRREDFLSSIKDERINLAIAKMRPWTTDPSQRVIMSTGMFFPDLTTGDVMLTEPTLRDGKTSLWPRASNVPIGYKAYASIRRRIAFRGATLLALTSNDELIPELKAMEKDLFYLSGYPVKDLFFPEHFPDDPPEEDDPLQQLRPVRDGRRVLAAFEGIGPKKANKMWEAVYDWMKEKRPLEDGIWTEEDWEPNTMQLLVWASSSKKARRMAKQPKVPLWGDKTYEKVREQLGLVGEANLRVEMLTEEKEGGRGAGLKVRKMPGLEEE